MKNYDIAIIGAGPGGYVAAIRAGQLGKKTVIIEKKKVGGMCLNWGCIPSKSLLESGKRFDELKDIQKFGVDGLDPEKLQFNWGTAVKRTKRIVARLTKGVEFLLKKNKVEIMNGEASITAERKIQVGDELIEAENIILATGSRPAALNITVPEDRIIDLEKLLSEKEIPENLVVFGSNSHAVEMAQMFSKIGKHVILNMTTDRMVPEVDPYLSEFLAKQLRKEKIEVISLGATDSDSFGDGTFQYDGKEYRYDKVVNGMPRQAVLPNIEMSIELDKQGFVRVDDGFMTSLPGTFAIGDVNGISSFAHAASAQGLNVVNRIAGIDKPYHNEEMPINIYTVPEMAQVGLSADKLSAEGIDFKTTEFPLTANGKALVEDKTNGFIRLLSEKKYGEVLGVQIVSHNATDMIAEASVLRKLEGTVFDLANAVHAHPTVSEIFLESGFAAFDQPIHT
mgnify:CR=1 FL=1